MLSLQALRHRARRRHLLRHAARPGAAVEWQDPLLPRRRLREPDPLDPLHHGDLLVLLPHARCWCGKITGQQGEAVGPFTSAVVAFIMVESAYYSEIIRAGIQSIPRGQPWAAYALGMNYWQAMGTVVLPQAFRNMVPIMLTQAIILFQDTSLVYVVGLKDFLGAASKGGQITGRIVELYVFVAFVFFVICFGASWLVKRIQARYAIVR